MDPASSSVARAVPLVVTGDHALRDDVLRLCAAAGVAPDLVDRVEAARGRWRAASCVVLGSDLAPRLVALGLPRREDVVIATRTEEATLWRDAVGVGAAQVVTLPAGQDWLVAWLTDTAEGAGGAEAIAVLGARGGAGASLLAATLALRAAHRLQVCLIDGDPWSGGLELLLGSEDEEGLRWPDVAVTHGRIGAAAFRAALPQHRGVTVLSWSPGAAAAVEATTMRTVLTAAARSFDVLVADLPRRLDAAAADALAASHHLLVVATADVRSVAAAASVLPSVHAHGVDVRLVVRTSGVASPTPEAMAESLGLPLVGVVPTRRAVVRSVDDGLGPPRRGPLAACCDAILDQLLPVRAPA